MNFLDRKLGGGCTGTCILILWKINIETFLDIQNQCVLIARYF